MNYSDLLPGDMIVKPYTPVRLVISLTKLTGGEYRLISLSGGQIADNANLRPCNTPGWMAITIIRNGQTIFSQKGSDISLIDPP